MSPDGLTTALKEEATRLGFDLAGATAAAAPPGIDRFRQWLADGYAADMQYMADRAEAYEHPRHVLDGAKSILMLAMNYRTVEPAPTAAGQGKVARYAWGVDYHDLIRRQLRRLADFHRRLVPDARARGVVDTAPLLERQFAQLAGLGWIGKNTCLINDRFGSWLFLAALLTTEELRHDEPAERDRCGSCRACLDACPTGALAEPYRLDARRCASYLSVELRGPIPPKSCAALGDRLFGCDACQQACPANCDTPATAAEGFQPAPGMNPVALAELFAMDEEGFHQQFGRSPIRRCGREGLLRNATVVLDNE
ncbi:MAG: tRNA epoxyqueuosine(34) reductase QueG [Candidatus Nealsonbacteria bacterium]|nr:tRNA epoxyqueuosine(34) reductase QueG [Candidatus Nealsonbacteria bacterium]